MKFLFAICVSLLMATWTCGAFAATANGSFNYDFASDPACSATITADCIDHFEIWDVTSTPKKLSAVAVPSTPNSAINFSFKVGPPYGSRKWSAVAVAKDGTASDMTAPQSQNTVNVRPGAPASFVVNLQ
jgi:hypothetical protein